MTVGSDAPKSWARWTTRRLRTRIEKVFGIDVCKETIRRALHRLGLSWKKAKKLLAKASSEKRRAFVADIHALLDRVLHDGSLVLAYIDEAHVHQDADMGYGWSPRGRRLYVASSSPGLSAKVSFYGVSPAAPSETVTRRAPCPVVRGASSSSMTRTCSRGDPGKRETIDAGNRSTATPTSRAQTAMNTSVETNGPRHHPSYRCCVRTGTPVTRPLSAETPSARATTLATITTAPRYTRRPRNRREGGIARLRQPSRPQHKLKRTTNAAPAGAIRARRGLRS